MRVIKRYNKKRSGSFRHFGDGRGSRVRIPRSPAAVLGESSHKMSLGCFAPWEGVRRAMTLKPEYDPIDWFSHSTEDRGVSFFMTNLNRPSG